jgi:oligosaccharide reducing-end xylanase
MAMALFFAQNRWGSSSLNYGQEANTILEVLRTKLFDSGSGLILFSPATSTKYTDPSYHLPAFYELFGQWASSNKQFWKDSAAKSRAFLKTAAHSTTGLFPEYAQFNGTPVAANTNNNSNSHRFAFDSWRVIQNMAVDYYWWSRDAELASLVQKQQQFFKNQGDYKSVYDLSGTAQATYTSPGHTWMNGVGSLVSNNQLSKDFIQRTPIVSLGSNALDAQLSPKGQYRYYDGLLYVMGYLHLSSNFKIYKPGQAAKLVDLSAPQKRSHST